MKWLAWLLAFSGSLLVAATVAPTFLGAASPDLARAVFVLGAALQRFRPAFWFTLVAGLLGDLLAFGSSTSYTLAAFLVFFVVRAVLSVSSWEEPMRRIAAVASGVVAGPFAFALASFLPPLLFGLPPAPSPWPAVRGRTFSVELLFTIVWFSLFVWVSMARFRVRQRARLARI